MFKEKDFSKTEIVNQTLLSFDAIELVFENVESVVMDKSVIRSISMDNFSERVIYAGYHQANPSQEKINLGIGGTALLLAGKNPEMRDAALKMLGKDESI